MSKIMIIFLDFGTEPPPNCLELGLLEGVMVLRMC